MPKVTISGLSGPTIAALDRLTARGHIPAPVPAAGDGVRAYLVTPRQLTGAIAKGVVAHSELGHVLNPALRRLRAWQTAQIIGPTGDTTHVKVTDDEPAGTDKPADRA